MLRKQVRQAWNVLCILSGFSVYAGNRIARDDKAGKEALAQYIMRNAFAERLVFQQGKRAAAQGGDAETRGQAARKRGQRGFHRIGCI